MSTPLEAHCLQIRELLASLGLEAREVAGSAGEEEELEQHVWMVGAGSATVLVRLIWDVKEEEGWFRVSSPLVHLPERNLLPFYRRLLELNSELPGVSLSAVHDVIELSGERPPGGDGWRRGPQPADPGGRMRGQAGRFTARDLRRPPLGAPIGRREGTAARPPRRPPPPEGGLLRGDQPLTRRQPRAIE